MIPHSHTDAGWWLTYNVYYHSRVRNILSTTFNYLDSKYQGIDLNTVDETLISKSEKMIWADYAFFIRWWDTEATP